MNPYEVLNASRGMTQKEIIQAVTLAMRNKEYSVQEIAIAQKELMNPVIKASHDFINFIEIPSSCNQLPERPNNTTSATNDLKRLSCFDETI